MKSVTIIGIGGRKGAGKDPTARVLAGFCPGPSRIEPLARGLKTMLAGLYQVPEDSPLLYTAQGKASPSPFPLRPGNTVRQDLIDLGDQTRALDPDIWVRYCREQIVQDTEAEWGFVPDLRYPNEKQICDLSIWVGPDDAGDHPTESALSSKDFDPEWVFQQPTVGERLQALRAKLLRYWPGSCPAPALVRIRLACSGSDPVHDS